MCNLISATYHLEFWPITWMSALLSPGFPPLITWISGSYHPAHLITRTIRTWRQERSTWIEIGQIHNKEEKSWAHVTVSRVELKHFVYLFICVFANLWQLILSVAGLGRVFGNTDLYLCICVFVYLCICEFVAIDIVGCWVLGWVEFLATQTFMSSEWSAATEKGFHEKGKVKALWLYNYESKNESTFHMFGIFHELCAHWNIWLWACL